MSVGTRHLVLDSRLDELDRLADAIGAFCAEAGVASEAPAFTLCAEEIVTNVVLHGFGGEAGHAIDATLRLLGGELTVEIADDATAFDPTAPTAPNLGAALEERAIGGLGRHLVSTMMQRFCYRRDDGRNLVTFGRTVAGHGER